MAQHPFDCKWQALPNGPNYDVPKGSYRIATDGLEDGDTTIVQVIYNSKTALHICRVHNESLE